MQYDSFSDEELIAKLRDGENEITDYILEKYKPLVRRCTNAMFLIGGETEDLIQEGMIGLFKAIRDFRQDRNVSFFAFARLCINRQLGTAIQSSNRRKHQPLNSYISLSEQGSDVACPLAESPEQAVIEQEVWEEYKKRLAGMLSRMEREVLDLYLDGCSYTQIAAKMGKSPKSIDNALQRIRQKIKLIHLD
jgi:RNA polymerase sporulation-specific sigma factor